MIFAYPKAICQTKYPAEEHPFSKHTSRYYAEWVPKKTGVLFILREPLKNAIYEIPINKLHNDRAFRYSRFFCDQYDVGSAGGMCEKSWPKELQIQIKIGLLLIKRGWLEV